MLHQHRLHRRVAPPPRLDLVQRLEGRRHHHQQVDGVNCINPVFNPDTGLSAEFAGGPVDDARRARFLATIPLGRFSTALDVANAALYLASNEAAFISGVCIEVDGARCV